MFGPSEGATSARVRRGSTPTLPRRDDTLAKFFRRRRRRPPRHSPRGVRQAELAREPRRSHDGSVRRVLVALTGGRCCLGVADEGGKGLDGGGFLERVHREIDPGGLADPGEEIERQDEARGDVEEVVGRRDEGNASPS